MINGWNEAVHAIVNGELASLERLLASEPELVHARGPAPHRPALLHYCAANGVEDELQRTPPNAPAIAEALLKAGSPPDPLGNAYGGGRNATPLCLLVSSWHPFERGVQAELVGVLAHGGAAIDGLDDDGAPLATALTFGYTRAAHALVECGARVDNILFAAGLGQVDAVRRWLEPSGRPGADALGSYVPAFLGVEIEGPEAIRQQALHFAVAHGQTEVADMLLAAGADANGESAGHHARLPLLQCLFTHRHSIVDLLLEHGANPHAVDGKLKCSAVDYAARTGRSEVSERLRHAGRAQDQ